MLVGAIFVRVILSWTSVDPRNPIASFIFDITEPILAPIRQFARLGVIDLSPMIASFLIIIIARIIGNAIT